MSIGDLSYHYGIDYDLSKNFSGDGQGLIYLNWEKDAIHMCKCDYGYFGPDCSQGNTVVLIVETINLLSVMCPRGDDPITQNQDNKKIILIVTTDSDFFGSLGIQFQGETSYLDLPSPSTPNCTRILETNLKFLEVECVFEELNPFMYSFSITFIKFPVYPVQNNIHTHDINLNIEDFSCDTTKTGADTKCYFQDIISTNLVGNSIYR